jgi:hypothetical protein
VPVSLCRKRWQRKPLTGKNCEETREETVDMTSSARDMEKGPNQSAQPTQGLLATDVISGVTRPLLFHERNYCQRYAVSIFEVAVQTQLETMGLTLVQEGKRKPIIM